MELQCRTHPTSRRPGCPDLFCWPPILAVALSHAPEVELAIQHLEALP